MSQKWNLQDIRPTGPRKPQIEQNTVLPKQDISVRRPKPSTESIDSTANFSDVATIDILDGNSERKKRILVSLVIVVVIFVVGIFVNSLTSGAEITVYPKYKDSTVQATFVGYQGPRAGELSYELLSLEASGERQVKASGEQTISERATGKILVYNAYSTASQRLIKNTRFESPEGYIYRIKESIEVPGATKNAQGELSPGVITADVFADGTGEQYNIKSSRFTIPGLKGSDQYEKVYAESTDEMRGGYEGKKFMINEDEFKTAEQALQLELRNALLERLKTERPAGFILYPGAVTFAFEQQPATKYGDDMATIKETAHLHVPIFPEAEFASYIARHTVSGFENSSVEIPNPMTLTFSYTNASTSLADISKLESLEFDLKGTTRIVWTLNFDKLKTDLLGLPKTAFESSIYKEYPEITKFKVDIKPFWKNSFPEDANKITITPIVGENQD